MATATKKTATAPLKGAALAAHNRKAGGGGGAQEMGAKGGAAVTATKPAVTSAPVQKQGTQNKGTQNKGVARQTTAPKNLPQGANLGSGPTRGSIERIIGTTPMAMASFHQSILEQAAFFRLLGDDYNANVYLKQAGTVQKWLGTN